MSFHDWIQGFVVVATTCTVLYSVAIHGSIPGDLAPSWALVIGAYIGSRVSATAAKQATDQANFENTAKTNGTTLH